MRLTVLGSSGTVGGPLSAASGYLLESGDNAPIVMDFGPGVLAELQQRCDPTSVNVILSHLHADHCLDLPSLLVWRRFGPTPAKGRATLVGPAETAPRIGAASGPSKAEFDDISDTFDVRTWTDGVPQTLGDLTITPFRMYHPPEAYGLRIVTESGGVFAFSGDTGVCGNLEPLARGADVFLCEASWTHDPGERPVGVHLSGTEAGQAATKAGVKSLVLTHIPPWTDTEAVLAEATAEFDGPIGVAKVGD